MLKVWLSLSLIEKRIRAWTECHGNQEAEGRSGYRAFL